MTNITKLEKELSLNFTKPDFSQLKDLNIQKIIYTNSHNQKAEYEIGTFKDTKNFKQIYEFDKNTLENILKHVDSLQDFKDIKKCLLELIESNNNYSSNKDTKNFNHLFAALVLNKINLEDQESSLKRNKKEQTIIKDTIKQYLFSSKIRLFEFSRMKMAS